LGAAGSVELAVLERSGMVESRHLGAAVVFAPSGSVARALGDVDALVYPRSSMKIFQAIAVARSGLALEGEQLVLSAASHGGTAAHRSVVSQILDAAGLDESALQCPADWPADSRARDELLVAGGEKSRTAMTCSGKHASMVASCAARDWPVDTYLDVRHPLQQLVRETVEDLTGHSVDHTGIDGCGTPVFALPLVALARGVQRVLGPASDDETGRRLAAAIRASPWAIDGPGRPDTVVAERLGVVAKFGAEGIMVMCAPDGTTVALKVLDGSLRAGTIVGLDLLADSGAIAASDAADVAALTTQRVLGRGVPVGAIRSSDLVRRAS
jgi:L-asparaginase II